MKVIMEMDFPTMLDSCWGGAVDTLYTIYKEHREAELIDLLEEMFNDTVITILELNDMLWFQDEEIFERLGISLEG